MNHRRSARVGCLLSIACAVLAAGCGGSGGGDNSGSSGQASNADPNQPTYSNMRYMHAGGIPYKNGPDAQAQGSTDGFGTFAVETPAENAKCYDSNGHAITCKYDISMSICGTPLPEVTTTNSWATFIPLNGKNSTFQLPSGYATSEVWTWLPTDMATAADFPSLMRVANNVTRVVMTGSTTTTLADGLQLSPAVATGSCQPFSYETTNLEADTASMQSIAPNPLVTVDAANAYLKELLVCRIAGAWQGENSMYITPPNSNNGTQITGDGSVIFDTAGGMTGYMDWQKNTNSLYTGSLNFNGALSLSSDEIDFTVPSGSGPLSYSEVALKLAITNHYGFYVDFLGPDGNDGGISRMSKVEMYHFNAVKKYVTTIQGTSKTWVLEVDDDGKGNIGGSIADAPHYTTIIAISGTKVGDQITFHSFDWNQGRPHCTYSNSDGKEDTSGCKDNSTDTGPEVAAPSVDGTFTVDSSTTTAVGTVTMPSDGINATFTVSAPLPGCYL